MAKAKYEKTRDRGIYKVINTSGSIHWMIDYYDPNRKRKRVTFKTLKVAREELAKRMSLIAENRYVDKKKEYTTTLGELAKGY